MMCWILGTVDGVRQIAPDCIGTEINTCAAGRHRKLLSGLGRGWGAAADGVAMAMAPLPHTHTADLAKVRLRIAILFRCSAAHVLLGRGSRAARAPLPAPLERCASRAAGNSHSMCRYSARLAPRPLRLPANRDVCPLCIVSVEHRLALAGSMRRRRIVRTGAAPPGQVAASESSGGECALLGRLQDKRSDHEHEYMYRTRLLM